MVDIPSSLLTYPFEKERILWPEPDQKTLIWGAQYSKGITRFSNITCFQSFFPYARQWKEQGIDVDPVDHQDNVFDFALLVLSKQKEESIYRIALASALVKGDGLIVATAENNFGGKRIEKWFEDLGFETESLSKKKCRIVWAKNSQVNESKIERAIEDGQPQTLITEYGDFIAKPGVFSWNKADGGSLLLVENLPETLTGTGADFGCGYGLLSHFLLSKNNNIQKVFAIDADYNALECCKENLKSFDDRVQYVWEDLTTDCSNISSLDWIIMNPPFHEGNHSDVTVGQQFIQTAYNALKPNGALYMVANQHLPYEKILVSLFADVQKNVEKQGFKVITARK